MCVGGQTTKSQIILTCQGFTIVLCETLRVSLPPLSGLGFQILQSAKVCEGTLQIVGGMLGNPAKTQPQCLWPFPLTAAWRWCPSEFQFTTIVVQEIGLFLLYKFFTTMDMEVNVSLGLHQHQGGRSTFLSRSKTHGDQNVRHLCILELMASFCNSLALNLTNNFEILQELSQTNNESNSHKLFFLRLKIRFLKHVNLK